MKRSILLLCGLFLFCASSYAAELKSEAGLLVQRAVNNILAQLRDQSIKTPGPKQDELLADIDATIKKHIDFQEFTARSVGGKWPSFSPQQKDDFVAAFSELLYYTYLGSLLKYSGQSVNFTGEVISSKGDKVEVKSSFLDQGKSIDINYRVMRKNNEWMLYDIYIESISLVESYRESFRAELQKSSPEEVIARLRVQAHKIKVQTETALGR
jgi:phospholipid transport system substrate-binding protein